MCGNLSVSSFILSVKTLNYEVSTYSRRKDQLSTCYCYYVLKMEKISLPITELLEKNSLVMSVCGSLVLTAMNLCAKATLDLGLD